MKKILYFAAMLAVMIGVAAPPADAAKTLRQRITALEKHNKKQDKALATLTALARDAQARAIDAQMSYQFLVNCILVQTAGVVDVLSSDTNASFVQGDATLGIADVFQWLPVTRTVVAPDGPSYLALLDPACIASPSPAPASRAARRGWHPVKVVLR